MSHERGNMSHSQETKQPHMRTKFALVVEFSYVSLRKGKGRKYVRFNRTLFDLRKILPSNHVTTDPLVVSSVTIQRTNGATRCQ